MSRSWQDRKRRVFAVGRRQGSQCGMDPRLDLAFVGRDKRGGFLGAWGPRQQTLRFSSSLGFLLVPQGLHVLSTYDLPVSLRSPPGRRPPTIASARGSLASGLVLSYGSRCASSRTGTKAPSKIHSGEDRALVSGKWWPKAQCAVEPEPGGAGRDAYSRNLSSPCGPSLKRPGGPLGGSPQARAQAPQTGSHSLGHF